MLVTGSAGLASRTAAAISPRRRWIQALRVSPTRAPKTRWKWRLHSPHPTPHQGERRGPKGNNMTEISIETERPQAGLVARPLRVYEREGSPYYATARLWDDGILEPAKTRDALALGLSAAFNAPIPDARFGVFRM